MKCDFCGAVFEKDECRSGCESCPMNRNCKKIKCPNCNYEMYPEPEHKTLGRIKNLFDLIGKSKKKSNRLNDNKSVNKKYVNLTELETGEKARILKINTNDLTKMRKLTAFGIMPGLDIIMIQRYPAFVVQIGFTQVALDEDIASEIIIDRL